LTPDPSFAHNLGYRCPNDQCEAIFDLYASRTFQWHQEHPNARCFGPCCRAMNIRESRRTPNPHLFQVLGFTPTLGQSRVATPLEQPVRVQLQQQWWPHIISSFQHQKYKTEGIKQNFNLDSPTNFTALSWAPYPFMNNWWNIDELQNKFFFTLGANHRSITCLPYMTMPIWSWVQVLQQTESIAISYIDTTKISKPDYLWRKTPFLDISTKRRNCIYLLHLPICLPLTYPCKNKTEWPFRSAVIVSS
jgi:hypothetical protein